MTRQITGTDSNGGAVAFGIQFPDECPICHRHVSPTALGAAVNASRDELQAVYRCTNGACDSIFIGIYAVMQGTGTLVRTTPTTPTSKEFEQTICDLSPAFVKIYNQAIAAEAFELDQVVGIGLRKALEFLIKDFATKQAPAEADSIKTLSLSKVINTYIADENLKKVAERATWLGNDETHYERIWEEKDLEDLKRLIRLSVNWIDNVLTTEQYIESMPKPTKRDKEL